jgi:hypothetical protein
MDAEVAGPSCEDECRAEKEGEEEQSAGPRGGVVEGVALVGEEPVKGDDGLNAAEEDDE